MMVKTTCVCDRCGKMFDEVKSKTIKIIPARTERKKAKTNETGLFYGLSLAFFNRFTVKDYCPECIEEIKGFIQKGAIESENSPDKH